MQPEEAVSAAVSKLLEVAVENARRNVHEGACYYGPQSPFWPKMEGPAADEKRRLRRIALADHIEAEALRKWNKRHY